MSEAERKHIHFYLLLFSLRGEPRNAERNLVRDKEREVDGTVLYWVYVLIEQLFLFTTNNVWIQFLKKKKCAFSHNQDRIYCTEEENVLLCVTGGNLGQGQLMYRLSICSYFFLFLFTRYCNFRAVAFFQRNNWFLIMMELYIVRATVFHRYYFLCVRRSWHFNTADRGKLLCDDTTILWTNK